MLENIKEQFIIRKEEIRFSFLFEIGTFLLGAIILIVITLLDQNMEQTFEIGTIVAFSSTMFAMFFVIFANFYMNFTTAICMCRTRKSFITTYYVLSFFIISINILLCYVFAFLEKLIYPIIFPNLEFHFVVLQRLTPVILLFIILSEVIIPIFVGVLLLRFGMKAFWILWAMWMLGTTVLPNLIRNAYDRNQHSVIANVGEKITNVLGGVSITAWLIILAAFLIAMFIVTIKMILKQEVKIR